MAAKFDLKRLNHPVTFSLAITLVVVGWIAVFSWGAMALGATGPLSVLKGGYYGYGSTGV